MPDNLNRLNRQISGSRDVGLFLEYLQEMENYVSDVRQGDILPVLRQEICQFLRTRIDTIQKTRENIDTGSVSPENDDV